MEILQDSCPAPPAQKSRQALCLFQGYTNGFIGMPADEIYILGLGAAISSLLKASNSGVLGCFVDGVQLNILVPPRSGYSTSPLSSRFQAQLSIFLPTRLKYAVAATKKESL